MSTGVPVINILRAQRCSVHSCQDRRGWPNMTVLFRTIRPPPATHKPRHQSTVATRESGGLLVKTLLVNYRRVVMHHACSHNSSAQVLKDQSSIVSICQDEMQFRLTREHKQPCWTKKRCENGGDERSRV